MMAKDDKWAANIAFIGDKKTVKAVLKYVENLEEEGKVADYTGIEGPYDSLQGMLKRRKDNLALPAMRDPGSDGEDESDCDGEDE